MTRVLFVCLGNICRSPMAEAIFHKKVQDQNLQMKIETDSCGTAAYHVGQSPDPRTVEIVHENGVSINHSGRQLASTDYYQFDYIIAMDKSNLSDILFRKPDDSKAEICLMRDYDIIPGDGEVPDPYYGGLNGFQKVFDMLDRSADSLLEDIITRSKG